MEKTTITISDKVWKELSLIKINAGYDTISDVIEDLIFRKNVKEDKKHGNTKSV